MAERRDAPSAELGPGNLAGDPLVRALVACLREVAERRAVERAAAHRRLVVVDGERRGEAA